MAWRPPLRTVILDPEAEAFVRREESSYRFRDQWEGIEWHLAHKPDRGLPRFPDEPTKNLIDIFPSNPLANLTGLWVLYSYDDETVTVHAAERAMQSSTDT